MLRPASPSSRRGLGTVRSHTTQTSGSMKRNFLPPANSTLQRRCTTPTERKPMCDYRSMFDLSGKTALVVGAGSGIGEASAQGLAAFGARVVCADVNKGAADNTASKITSEVGEADSIELDMTDPDSVRRAVESAGVPDVLVSTPSINVRKPVLEITDHEFDQIVELNLKGTFRLIRDFGRGMAERGSGRDGADAAGPCFRSRTPRCQGQRHSAWHRRDAFDGPDQRLPRLVRLLRRQEHPGPLGHAARDGRDGPLSRLGSQLLRHGRLHAGRRRLDRRGWTLHASALGFRRCARRYYSAYIVLLVREQMAEGEWHGG